jgi:signal peptidase I
VSWVVLESVELPGQEFFGLSKELVGSGIPVRFQVHGRSMYPLMRDGDIVEVASISVYDVQVGDVVFFRSGERLLAHRVTRFALDEQGMYLRARGDGFLQEDPPIREADLVGRVVTIHRGRGHKRRTIQLDRGVAGCVGRLVAQSPVVHRCVRGVGRGVLRAENLVQRLFNPQGVTDG